MDESFGQRRVIGQFSHCDFPALFRHPFGCHHDIFTIPEKIDRVRDRPIPCSVKEVRSFLGLYMCIITDDLSNILLRLHLLLINWHRRSQHSSGRKNARMPLRNWRAWCYLPLFSRILVIPKSIHVAHLVWTMPATDFCWARWWRWNQRKAPSSCLMALWISYLPRTS